MLAMHTVATKLGRSGSHTHGSHRQLDVHRTSRSLILLFTLFVNYFHLHLVLKHLILIYDIIHDIPLTYSLIFRIVYHSPHYFAYGKSSSNTICTPTPPSLLPFQASHLMHIAYGVIVQGQSLLFS
ncbi:uncharacterized protein F5147DRAFT_107570 [Suillus discolor]|uniref:Uncharacterized protein n=1 Tax=Suillus discolor TaxID=1912936 RepID=A0A9P7F8V9_9AGAM|nr:uncharacterized protein F5147DRAFT_107570 [Suillus discolor]KAG2110907.1 hypothetical protein F5147DRAFT_107570 [Suillus discolor]